MENHALTHAPGSADCWLWATAGITSTSGGQCPEQDTAWRMASEAAELCNPWLRSHGGCQHPGSESSAGSSCHPTAGNALQPSWIGTLGIWTSSGDAVWRRYWEKLVTEAVEKGQFTQSQTRICFFVCCALYRCLSKAEPTPLHARWSPQETFSSLGASPWLQDERLQILSWRLRERRSSACFPH